MRRYEKFKLEWLIEHGYELNDIILTLKDIYEENKDLYDEEFPIEEVFREFEEDIGFDGEIYPSYDEYLNNDL